MPNNIANTKKAYAAFSTGDIPTLLELIAPDCVWNVGGQSQLAGTYTGHDQILGYFAKLAEVSGGTFSVELIDLAELPASGMITVLINTSMTVSGTTTQVRMVQLARNNAAGQVAECWWFSEDQHAQDAALGPMQIVLPDQKAKAKV